MDGEDDTSDYSFDTPPLSPENSEAERVAEELTDKHQLEIDYAVTQFQDKAPIRHNDCADSESDSEGVPMVPGKRKHRIVRRGDSDAISSVFESPEKVDSNHDASDAGKETSCLSKSRKKLKATVASFTPNPDSKRVWSKNEELVILKGIVDYQNETGVKYSSDSGAFLDYIKKDIDGEFSKDQLMRKIRKLKKRFLTHLVKKTCFTSPEDSELFELSMKTWDKDNAECADGNIDKANGTKSRSKSKSKSRKARLAFVEHEAVINGEPEDDDGLGKDNNESPAGNVDKQTENETGVKESEEDEPKNDDGSEKDDSYEDKFPNENLDKPMEEEVSEDELLALNDALETMMFEGLSKLGKKLMLRKLMKLGAKERKELSDEWKALLRQDTLLKCKKQFLSVKLGKAILDD